MILESVFLLEQRRISCTVPNETSETLSAKGKTSILFSGFWLTHFYFSHVMSRNQAPKWLPKRLLLACSVIKFHVKLIFQNFQLSPLNETLHYVGHLALVPKRFTELLHTGHEATKATSAQKLVRKIYRLMFEGMIISR